MDLNAMEKRRTLAKKIVPLLALIILIPLISFMMYPMINMEPRDLHVGIVNKDRGADFDQGSVNLGNKIIDTITDLDTDSDTESPVIWEVYDTEDDAKAAMKHKDIYGYLIIPGNFSKKQTQQLTAFNNLSSALSNMSEGTGKMGEGINQASGKLSQIPTAFRNLAKAIGKLGDGAGGLQTAVGAMGGESAAISEAAAKIDSSAEDVKDNLSEAQTTIETAKATLNEALSEDPLDPDKIQNALTALAEAESKLESASTAADNAKSSNASNVQTIAQNAGMISAQSEGVNKGLAGIQQGGKAMSANLNTMAGKMSGVSNIKQLGSALGQLSEGLDTMSDTMDENVTDAIAAMNGETEADENDTVKLKFYIDQSRNVLVTSTLTGMINGISANAGLSIETKYKNRIPDELNNFYFAMVFMMLIMFTSMIPGILTGFFVKPEGRIPAKAKTIAGQIILVAVIAACLGFIIPRAIAWMGGFDLPVERLTPFVMICCFSMLMIIVGAIDLFGRPGVIVPVLIMICGTAVANLPYEYLPTFWQKYIFPWEPLRFIAEGVREIIYRGGEAFNQYAHNMLWLVVIGATFMLLSMMKKRRPAEEI